MKFATKLSLGCITLLSCALCAAGLILTGKSFSGSLETTRAAMQAQQAKEKYTLERCIFTAAETNTLFSTNTMVENYTPGHRRPAVCRANGRCQQRPCSMGQRCIYAVFQPAHGIAACCANAGRFQWN